MVTVSQSMILVPGTPVSTYGRELNFDCLKLDGCFSPEDPELKRKMRPLSPILSISATASVSVSYVKGVRNGRTVHLPDTSRAHHRTGILLFPSDSSGRFYDIYRKQNGCYPLPFRNNHNTDRTAHESGGLPKSDLEPSLNPALNRTGIFRFPYVLYLWRYV